jgi:hypothetical protein
MKMKKKVNVKMLNLIKKKQGDEVEAKRVDSIEGMVGAKEERRDIEQDMTTILEDIVGI